MPSYQCCVCERSFQFGPHVYAGRRIPGWHDSMICKECDRSNREGVVPDTHPRLVQRLKALKVRIILNEEGWIMVPSIGSN